MADEHVGDDNPASLDDDTFQQVLDSIATPSLVMTRNGRVAGSPEEPLTKGHVPYVSSSLALDSKEPQFVFQLREEGVLEGVRRCLSPNKDISETIKGTYPSLHRME